MSKSAKSTTPDYEVGRGKPPKESRFKPGQSGNPGGRRKGSTNVRTIVTLVLESEIELIENGKKRKISLVEALLKRQAQEALRGNNKAINDLLDRYERHCPATAEDRVELPEEDQQLLERALSSRRVVGSSAANDDDLCGEVDDE